MRLKTVPAISVLARKKGLQIVCVFVSFLCQYLVEVKNSEVHRVPADWTRISGYVSHSNHAKLLLN